VAKRDNHYEAAFEAYLRGRRIPYVAVDETRRSPWGAGSLKSPDFIVSWTPGGRSWLVDVKGRRFPSGRQKHYWRNWTTLDDLRGLAQWQELFGPRFCSLLVFAYNVVGDMAPMPLDQLFKFRGSLYGFVAIRLDHYVSFARPISPKWDTVAMPAARFRDLAEPLDVIFQKWLPLAKVDLSAPAGATAGAFP
jgi:hypothetical protein